MTNCMKVLLALSSQWAEPDRREEMVESGRKVIKIIHSKLGAGSLSASTSLPGPGVFRKLHVKLSNSYDKGEPWLYVLTTNLDLRYLGNFRDLGL